MGNISSQNKVDNPFNYTLGDPIELDATIVTVYEEAYPNNTDMPDNTAPLTVDTDHPATMFADWGGDIFDDFGMFYIYDANAPDGYKYTYIVLDNINTAVGELFTQTVTCGYDSSIYSRQFTIKYGFPVEGIFRLSVEVADDNYDAFRIGMFGNLGSDEDTTSSDLTTPFTWQDVEYTMYYMVNMEGESVTNDENLYIYMIPYQVGQQSGISYTANYYTTEDLSIYSKEVNTGITLYMSKGNDVKDWVIYDLTNTDEEVHCLTKDATILTPTGYTPITKLKTNDIVTTHDGRNVPIVSYKCFTVEGNKKTWPYIVPPNFFGPNYPPSETIISGNHAIQLNDAWVLPKALPLKQHKMNVVTYYHLQLPNVYTDHLVINNGLVVESDGNNLNMTYKRLPHKHQNMPLFTRVL